MQIVLQYFYVETDVCVASPGLDSLTLRGSVELAQTLLKGHLMLRWMSAWQVLDQTVSCSGVW